jgi:hypothetical protein
MNKKITDEYEFVEWLDEIEGKCDSNFLDSLLLNRSKIKSSTGVKIVSISKSWHGYKSCSLSGSGILEWGKYCSYCWSGLNSKALPRSRSWSWVKGKALPGSK